MPPSSTFKWLDIPTPPKAMASTFLGFSNFNRNSLRLSPTQLEALAEFQGRATQRVWVPKDCQPLVEWLKVNEKPLALVHEAVKAARSTSTQARFTATRGRFEQPHQRTPADRAEVPGTGVVAGVSRHASDR